MDKRKLWSNILVILGLVFILIGTVDPLECAMFIFAGSLLVTIGAMVDKSRYRILLLWSSVLIAFGVGAMIVLSNLGGLGGRSGHSFWWGLLILPYPIGWFMDIVGIILRLIESFKKPKEIPSSSN